MFKNILKQISIFFLIAIFASGCSGDQSKTPLSTSYEQDNNTYNANSDGLVLSEEGWIYYSNQDKEGSLYKERLNGDNEKVLMNARYSCQLNIINGWIYYANGYPGEVYRVDINGNRGSKIINKEAGNLIVTKENIFYRLSYDNDWGKLYRTDLKGHNKVKLANNVIQFAISNGWLYYSNGDDNSSLYRMDLNGENIIKLNNVYSFDINPNGNYVFYTDYNDGCKLYRMTTDGTENTLLSREECWNVILSNGYIYYRNQTQQGRLYRMKLDGSGNEVITKRSNCVPIDVTKDFLIYRIPESTGGYFKTNLDGSNSQKWGDAY